MCVIIYTFLPFFPATRYTPRYPLKGLGSDLGGRVNGLGFCLAARRIFISRSACQKAESEWGIYIGEKPVEMLSRVCACGQTMWYQCGITMGE